jgi:CRP-like cAMP-binding protein
MLTDGSVHRITAQALHNVMDACPDLRSLLLRYCLAFNLQASQTALSNAVATVEQRVARWILMCEDRAAGIEIKLTHETIATILGVQRASITTELGSFEQENLIKTQRREIKILERHAIEQIAGNFYGFPELEYQRLVSTSWPQGFNNSQVRT